MKILGASGLWGNHDPLPSLPLLPPCLAWSGAVSEGPTGEGVLTLGDTGQVTGAWQACGGRRRQARNAPRTGMNKQAPWMSEVGGAGDALNLMLG